MVRGVDTRIIIINKKINDDEIYAGELGRHHPQIQIIKVILRKRSPQLRKYRRA